MTKWRWFRIMSIVGMALRFFLQIFWYQWKKKSKSEWDELMRRQARDFKELAIRLEGLLIKIGQFLSIRGDMLPQAFVEEISQLVDQVPASGWELAQAQLEREWGKSYREVFRYVSQEPVASASIGEVYQAELQDGTKVAVKIQRTGIDQAIHADFQAIKIVTWMAKTFTPFSDKVNFPMLYRELKTVIERELDFLKEMETAQEFKKRFAQIPNVHIPEMYPSYTTRKVMVMEWMAARKITDQSFLMDAQIDRKDLAERLLKLFVPQWLEPGKFHADPHPGNVLISENGDIVLIDYGMMGEISKKDAEYLQQFILAVGMKNYAKAVEYLIKLEFVLPSADRKEMEAMLEEVLSFDIQSMKQMNQMEMLKMKMELQEAIQALPIQVPTRFVFLGRSFVTVEGLVAAIYPEEDFLEIGEPLIRTWLKDQKGGTWKLMISWFQDQPIFQFLRELPDLLQEPRKLREWKGEEQRRTFEFQYLQGKKRDALVIVVLSSIFCYIAVWLKNPDLWLAPFVVGVFSTVYYGYTLRQLKKLLKRK